jgi:ABC-type transport system involved in multi-copper enzyme maturation permease subunit
MLGQIFQIAKYTFVENLKRKNFLILLVYIVVVIGSGILFSMLSPSQEIRVILDIGIAAIEIFAFLSCTFIAVRVIIQEMEQKTVYLILSRPISRAQYLIGRLFGILGVSFTYLFIMGISLLLMLIAKGWNWNMYFPAILWSIFLKIVIVASFAILLSLVSTSSASSFVSIFFLWTLGHFAEELKYVNSLLQDANVQITLLIKTIYYILPNFSKLNYKDFFHVKTVALSDFFWLSGYSILYSAILITLGIIIFNKKEL